MHTDHDADPLSSLVNGLLLYLDELESWRQCCIRHAPTTQLSAREDGTLSITKRYHCAEGADNQLRRRLQSLHQRGDGKGGRASLRLPRGSVLLIDGWAEHVAGRLQVFIAMDGGILTVTTQTPAHSGDLPTLPLHIVADALVCHEELVPDLWFTPLRVRKNGKVWPIQAYLLHSMRRVRFPPRSAFTLWPDA